MRAIVIGAGKAGFEIALRLSEEGHDAVVIDKSAEALAEVNERLDVMTIQGNGASPAVLEKAGVENAQLVIAEIELHVERTARLEPRIAQVVTMDADDRQARQQRIAILTAVANDAQPRNRSHVERARQVLELHRVLCLPLLVVDFLQAVDVAIELFQDLRDTRRQAAAERWALSSTAATSSPMRPKRGLSAACRCAAATSRRKRRTSS